MKKIIATTLIATTFISLLLSANVKPQERKQQSVPITTTTYMAEKENITTEPVTKSTTITSTTTITTTVETMLTFTGTQIMIQNLSVPTKLTARARQTLPSHTYPNTLL